MDSDVMPDGPSSGSDTLSQKATAGTSEAVATTKPPTLSNFTLPDPSSVPPVLDHTDSDHQTETSSSHQQEVTQAKEDDEASDLLQGPEREARTFGAFKNCDICQVVLNSASQAEMHYAGKTHQKKLRRIADMKVDSDTEETTLSILPSTSGTAKGLTMPHCDICGLTFTAMSQAKMHLSGARHAKRLRKLGLSTNEEVADPSEPMGSKGKEKEAFVCTFCKIICTSKLQLEHHFQGSKHKNVVDAAANAEENRLATSSSSVNSPPETNFSCAPCNVSTNSEQQYLQHMGSPRHKNKLLHLERESRRHHPYPPKQDALQKKLMSSNVNFKQNVKSSNTYKAAWGQNTRSQMVPYGARFNNSRSQAGNFTGSRRGNSFTNSRGRNNAFHQDPTGPSHDNPPYQQSRYFARSGRGNSLNQQCRVPNQDQSDDDVYNHNAPNLLSSSVFPNQDGSFRRPNMTNSAVGDNSGRSDASNFDDSWVHSSANHMKLGFGRGSGWGQDYSW